MGTKFPSIQLNGYNATPPSDDGSQSAANQVTWAKTVSKIGNPLKTYADAVNSAVATALSTSCRIITTSDSTLAGDHWRTVQISATTTSAITVSLMDAVTAANGYIVTVANASAFTCTIGRVTASNTIGTVTASISILALETITFIVNAAADGYLVLSRNGATTAAGSVTLTSLDTNASKAVFQAKSISVDFRLSLATATPVTVTDQTAKTTIYMTPYVGNNITLYINSAWKAVSTAEISVAVPATTVTPFDIFAGDENDDGVVTLTTVNWTNDTTRAVALSTQDGILVGATPGRRYLGTGRTTGSSGQCEDSLVKRFLWNYYNPVTRLLRKGDSTSTWAYASATVRYANGDSANKVEIVVGVVSCILDISSIHLAGGTDSTGVVIVTAIGVDSGTVGTTDGTLGQGCGTGTFDNGCQANLLIYPAIGYHYLAWLESTNARTANFLSASQTGLIGSIQG